MHQWGKDALVSLLCAIRINANFQQSTTSHIFKIYLISKKLISAKLTSPRDFIQVEDLSELSKPWTKIIWGYQDGEPKEDNRRKENDSIGSFLGQGPVSLHGYTLAW